MFVVGFFQTVKIKDDDDASGFISYQSEYLDRKHGNYTIVWYNPPFFLRSRPTALHCGFKVCEYNNCKIEFDVKKTPQGDAVIFDGRYVKQNAGFKRPQNQVWIFAAHEAPVAYDLVGGWWKTKYWVDQFNWTMTYNEKNADIFLPYGKLRKRKHMAVKNYRDIALQKIRSALIITSHCNTDSKRENYIKELSRFYPVKVLGQCGTHWDCGQVFVHDDCFEILNRNYMFYLAFENALCDEYMTEKFYANYNFDIILISRSRFVNNSRLPKEVFISTDDFETPKHLAQFLNNITVSEYAKRLELKDQYMSLNFEDVYQDAMCELCKRMNKLTEYRKTITNIKQYQFEPEPCLQPMDV